MFNPRDIRNLGLSGRYMERRPPSRLGIAMISRKRFHEWRTARDQTNHDGNFNQRLIFRKPTEMVSHLPIPV